MKWDEGLTGASLNIAQSNHNPIRVVAGPGTGKTFAMKRRVARLIEEGNDPSKILAVTFTRVAAEDIKKELNSIGIPGCNEIRTGTLHSYCFSLLTKENVFKYLNRNPRPLISFLKSKVMQFEAAPMLEDIKAAGNFGNKRDCSKRIRAFEADWARLQSDKPGWPIDQTDKQFHHELIEWLRFHNAMLIGELIPETLKYLRDNPTSDELTVFEHIIIDEYQDLNKAEQTLLDLLSTNSEICIVGDPDQSIYQFRHAFPEGILQYSDAHPSTRDEELKECRRCPKVVVQVADHLIRNNYLESDEIRLTPYRDNPDGELNILQWNDLNQETGGIATYINYLTEKKGYSPGDIIVLTPRRQIAYGIRDSLDSLNVPALSLFKDELLQPDEAQIAFAYLTLLADVKDRVALRFLLGYGSNTWLSRQYSLIQTYCIDNNLSPWEVLNAIDNGAVNIAKTSHIIKAFRNIKEKLDELNGKIDKQLVNSLFPESEEWTTGFRQLIDQSELTNHDAQHILELLTYSVTQGEIPEGEDYVRIMSLHKSKGLTSKVVIVCGCIQSLIPFVDQNLTPAEISRSVNEQRRLFYVAITRCKDILVLSSSVLIDRSLAHKMNARLFPGASSDGQTMTSQFINELGPSAPQSVTGVSWINSLLEAD